MAVIDADSYDRPYTWPESLIEASRQSPSLERLTPRRSQLVALYQIDPVELLFVTKVGLGLIVHRLKRRLWIGFVAITGIFSMSCPSARAYVGMFYADFGQQDKDAECLRIIDAFKAYNLLQPYPAHCVFLQPSQSWGFYHQVDEITLQFKQIDGSVYEMVYDIPNVVANEITNPLHGYPLRAALAAIGVGDQTQAISAAIDRVDAAKRAKADQPPSQAGSIASGAYVNRLRTKFEKQIRFRSQAAADIVRAFNVDCGSKDGRFVPLTSILLVGISQLQSDRSSVVDYVEEASGEVRIFQSLEGAQGPITRPELAFEVDKWGELHPYGIPSQAITNACYGAFGPIWVVPRK